MNPGQTSYCIQCDAPPGECQHTGPRYLDPITYEKTEAGWKVPDHERKRWEHRPTHVPKLQPDPPPIQELVIELEAWLDLDVALEAKLRNVYAFDPGRTARAANYTIDQVKEGKTTSPGGLLMVKLREIEKKEAA